MAKISPLLIALLVVASVGVLPGTAVADDDWPERCDSDDVTVVDATGEYDVTIDTPDDRDVFKVELDIGEYIHISTLVPDVKHDLRLGYVRSEGDASLQDGKNVIVRDRTLQLYNFERGEKASWKLWAESEGSNTYCFRFREAATDAEVPYKYSLNLSLNNPEPPKVGSQRIKELESELEEKKQRINEFESQLEQKDQRISDLKSQLEQKNQTISQLKQQSGDVNINIEVEPAGSQQNFIKGGKARISVNSENADWDKFSVEYKGDSYSVGDSGTTTIPLSGTGDQQLRFHYGEMSKSTSISVKSQATVQQTTSGQGGNGNQQSSTETTKKTDSNQQQSSNQTTEGTGSNQESRTGTTERTDGNQQSSNQTTQDTDGDGVPDSEDYAPRDPDVQDKDDLQTTNADGPGFGVVAGTVALLGGALLLGRYR